MSSLQYPLSIVNGDIEVTTDDDEIKRNAVKSSVMTLVGERVMRPDYGRTYDVLSALGNVPDLLRQTRNFVKSDTDDYDIPTFQVLGRPSQNGSLELTVLLPESSLQVLLSY